MNFHPTRPRRGLIKTKLSAPVPTPNNITRDALLGALTGSADTVRVITIVAPAGSGKSVIMGQFQRYFAETYRCCWLSLGPQDDDAYSFLAYFIAALGSLSKRLQSRASQSLDAAAGRHPDEVFAVLCEEIASVSQRSAIFIDDFHYLKDPTIHTGMDRFITALPASVTLVIASRSQLALQLSQVRLQGALLSFGPDNLSFSTAETATFLSQFPGLQLAQKDINRLAQSTEGWAAGLQLSALALQSEPHKKQTFMAGLSNNNRDLADHLMSSVLQAEALDVQHFLLRSAPLERMNPALCQHVTDNASSAEMIDYLRRQNLFVIDLDAEGSWFRYHHLFADFLITTLKQRDPDGYKRVSIAASKWFIEHGYLTEAIQHLLNAQQFKEAAILIVEHAAQVARYNGDHRTMLDWMRRLPRTHHDDHPTILLNQAWSLIFTQSSDEARAILHSVSEQLAGNSNPKWSLSPTEVEQIESLIETMWTVACASEDDSNAAYERAERALAKWPNASEFEKGALYNALAYSALANLAFNIGLQAASQARVMGLRANARYVIVWADWISSLLCLKMAALNDAEQHLAHGRQWVDSDDGANAHTSMLYAILQAELALDRGDVASAEATLPDWDDCAALIASREPLFILQRTRARLLVAGGQIQPALHFLRDCEEQSLASGAPRMAILLSAEALKIQFRTHAPQQQRIPDLSRWDSLVAVTDQQITDNRQDSNQIKCLMQIRLCMMRQDYAAALTQIETLQKSTQLSQRGRLQVELMLMNTLCLWRSNQPAAATETLLRTLKRAAPERYIAPFIESPVDMRDIFVAALQAPATTPGQGNLLADPTIAAFAQSALAALPPIGIDHPAAPIKAPDPEQLSAEPLTQREREILQHAASGMSNDQLADALSVSVSTVKWHLHNVYSKLGVKNRTAAIARAKSASLIS